MFTSQYSEGDKVWLDAHNLKLQRPSEKLSHKRVGPFTVLERTGDLMYKLDLPPSMSRIHPVFHTTLLTPHCASDIPGRTFPEPVPLIVDGEKEYKVEQILDSRHFRKKLQYLVK